MNPVVEFVLTTVTTAGVGAAVLWPLLKPTLSRYVARRVDFGFDARLDVHRQKLDVITETAKFELQKRLTGANLYTQRRHDAYPLVYQKMRVAHGLILNQRGSSTAPTFEEYDENDIRAYLSEYGAPSGFIADVLARWRDDKPEAVKMVEPYVRMLKRQDAERRFMDAKNELYLSELYFSDEVVDACNKFIDAGAEALAELEFPTPRAWPKIKKQLNEALEGVHTVMRKELAAA